MMRTMMMKSDQMDREHPEPRLRLRWLPWLLISGVMLVPGGEFARAAGAGSPGQRGSLFSAEERATLMQYARDTWRGFDRLLLPSSLPADGLRRNGDGWSAPWMQTSPTNIAAYLWSVLAAERLHLISAAEARLRLDRTLLTLARMDACTGSS